MLIDVPSVDTSERGELPSNHGPRATPMKLGDSSVVAQTVGAVGVIVSLIDLAVGPRRKPVHSRCVV